MKAGLLVLLGFGALFGWSVWQFPQPALLTEEECRVAIDAPPPMRLLSTPASTDRGNPIGLHVARGDHSRIGFDGLAEEFITQAGLSLKAIRTAPPSFDSNCHGWTFTGGRYWISGDDVARILEDNGYRPAQAARVGDLVVYRVREQIVHTAVVIAILPEDTVLVEGNWFTLGRFLHRVEDQPYADEWQFYSSPRASHLLRDLPEMSSASSTYSSSPPSLGIRTSQ